MPAPGWAVVEEVFVVLWYLANFYKCVCFHTFFFLRGQQVGCVFILELLFIIGLISKFYTTLLPILPDVQIIMYLINLHFKLQR